MAKMESKSESKKEMAMDKKQDVAMIKKAFKEHDAQEHKGGKGTKLALKKGGNVKKMNEGAYLTPSQERTLNMVKTGNYKSPNDDMNYAKPSSSDMNYVKPSSSSNGSPGAIKKMAKGGVTGKALKAVGRNMARANNQRGR